VKRGQRRFLGLRLGGLALGGVLILCLLVPLIFNRVGKAKIERAFAVAFPRSALRIATLDYSIRSNGLVARAVTISGTHLALKAESVALTGIGWRQLLSTSGTLAENLAKARLDVSKLVAEFPQVRYRIHCGRVRASVPSSELLVEETELRPLVGDDEFFGSRANRTTRFHVAVPECRISGLEYAALWDGTRFKASLITLARPSLDALVNCDKPSPPFVKSPMMVHEALAAIRQPLQVDRLNITDGQLTYGERVLPGAEPGVLTFGAVNLSVLGIANRGATNAFIQLQGQGNLMNAGTLKLQMAIPVALPEFSMQYSGSLSAMNLDCLNAFLDLSQHTRIVSGTVQEATFEIDVTAGQARGRVQATYRDLKIAVLDKRTGAQTGFENRLSSFLANVFKVRNSNGPIASGHRKEGKVDYTRVPEDEFLQFAWYALRSGVLDVISH
jgi:hypothetical protein